MKNDFHLNKLLADRPGSLASPPKAQKPAVIPVEESKIQLAWYENLVSIELYLESKKQLY